jgi:hypothetical protein
MNDIDPQAWLPDVLDRIATHPAHGLDELLPWNWAAMAAAAAARTCPSARSNHVHSTSRVAEMLGEDEDWLWDVATETDREDGLIWVYGPGDESLMAVTDLGIETLTGLIHI